MQTVAREEEMGEELIHSCYKTLWMTLIEAILGGPWIEKEVDCSTLVSADIMDSIGTFVAQHPVDDIEPHQLQWRNKD